MLSKIIYYAVHTVTLVIIVPIWIMTSPILLLIALLMALMEGFGDQEQFAAKLEETIRFFCPPYDWYRSREEARVKTFLKNLKETKGLEKTSKFEW